MAKSFALKAQALDVNLRPTDVELLFKPNIIF